MAGYHLETEQWVKFQPEDEVAFELICILGTQGAPLTYFQAFSEQNLVIYSLS